MCRLIVRMFNNHRIGIEPPERRPLLWHRGDVVEILEDGQTAGKKAEASKNFGIIECPGVPRSELEHLLDKTENSGRVRGLSLAVLDSNRRAELTKGQVIAAQRTRP